MGLLFLIFVPMKTFQEILQQTDFSHADLVALLSAEGDERQQLFQRAQSVKLQTIGNKVYFRGLVEFSNICAKDCLYCGIRKSNDNVIRYEATDDEILDACRFAWENRFGSVVLQSGELSSPVFVERINRLLRKIKELSNGELGITLTFDLPPAASELACPLVNAALIGVFARIGQSIEDRDGHPITVDTDITGAQRAKPMVGPLAAPAVGRNRVEWRVVR